MLKIRRSHDRLIFNMGIPIPGKMVFILKWDPGPIYKMHDVFSILPNQLLSRKLFQKVLDDIQRHLTAQTFGSISGQVGCTDWQLQRHIDQGDLQAHLHVVDEFWVKRGGWRPWRGQLSCHFGNGRGIGGRDGGWRGAGSSLWRETSSIIWLIRTVSGYQTHFMKWSTALIFITPTRQSSPKTSVQNWGQSPGLGSTPEYQLQLQLQLQLRGFQLQLQLRQLPGISTPTPTPTPTPGISTPTPELELELDPTPTPTPTPGISTPTPELELELDPTPTPTTKLTPRGGYSAWKLMGVCRWPLKIGPKKIEEKIEFGAKKIDFCKNW